MRCEAVGDGALVRLHGLPRLGHRRPGRRVVRLGVVLRQLLVGDPEVRRDVAQERGLEVRAEGATLPRWTQLQLGAGEQVRDANPVKLHVLRAARILVDRAEVAARILRDGLHELHLIDLPAAERLIDGFCREVGLDGGRIGRVDDGVLQHRVAEPLGDTRFLEGRDHTSNATRLIGAELLEDVDHLDSAPLAIGLNPFPLVGIRGEPVSVGGLADMIGDGAVALVELDAAANAVLVGLRRRIA